MITKLKQLFKKPTVAYLVNGIFAAAVILMFFDPAAKALMIQGLMKAGLFQPDITENIKPIAEPLPEVSFQNSKGDVVNLPEPEGQGDLYQFLGHLVPALHCRNACNR